MSMFHALCLSQLAPNLAIFIRACTHQVARRNRGDEACLQQYDGVRDYVADIEYLGRPYLYAQQG